MIADVRDALPVLLIPSAWIVTYLIINDSVQSRSMRIAHIVMLLFISIFLVTGYEKMREGVLKVWLGVLLAGWGITLAGLIGFYVSTYSYILHWMSLLGWMLIPSIGLLYTGYRADDIIYYLSSLINLIGVGLTVVLSPSIGVLVVAVGQTVGMSKAVWDSKYRVEEDDGHEGI